MTRIGLGKVRFVDLLIESHSDKTSVLCGFPVWGHLMLDTATSALSRAILDEVCESVSAREIGARTHVASKILEAATRGEVSPEGLRQVGREALSWAPTMWR